MQKFNTFVLLLFCYAINSVNNKQQSLFLFVLTRIEVGINILFWIYNKKYLFKML